MPHIRSITSFCLTAHCQAGGLSQSGGMTKRALLFIAFWLGACGPADTGDGSPDDGSQMGDGDTGDRGDGDGGGDGDGDGDPGDPEAGTTGADGTEGDAEEDADAISKVLYGPKPTSAVMVQGFAADDSMLADLSLEVKPTEFGSVATLHANVTGMEASWMLFNADHFEPEGDPLEYPLIRARAKELAAVVGEDGEQALTTCAVDIADAVADCTYSPYDPSCRAAFERAYCRCRPWLPEVEHVKCWIDQPPNS